MNPTARLITGITTAFAALTTAGLVAAAALPLTGHPTNRGGSVAAPAAPAAGVSAVEIGAERSDVTVTFGDVPEVEIRSNRDDTAWTLRTSGDTLIASNSSRLPMICILWCGPRGERVTLTLPRELEGRVDARVEAASGALRFEGDLTRLELRIGAGSVMYAGATPELDVEVAAGLARLDVAGTAAARFDVAAGQLEARLAGAAPSSIDLTVAAGEANLTVPDEFYRVVSDVAFGDFDNNLRTDPTSARVVTVDLSAGSVALRSDG